MCFVINKWDEWCAVAYRILPMITHSECVVVYTHVLLSRCWEKQCAEVINLHIHSMTKWLNGNHVYLLFSIETFRYLFYKLELIWFLFSIEFYSPAAYGLIWDRSYITILTYRMREALNQHMKICYLSLRPLDSRFW